MYHKIFIILLLAISSTPIVNAHDFDTETMAYILWNPEASWSDFAEYVATSDDASLQEEIKDTQTKLSLILSLPGKKYVGNYAIAHPDFNFIEIQELIADDPMLSEIGAETIYSFLKTALSEPWDTSVDTSFFLRTIVIWFQHISSWYDHILFLLTLIVCLPKFRRIVGIITTFTIAHCITLVLWGLHIISLPSILVESMILISIIIMALYALRNKVWEVKNIYFETTVIFILGLFHGLWFAGFFSGVLETSQNIIIPVLGFNIWVELGQVIIMSCILTTLYYIYKYFSTHKNHIKNTLSILCIIAASCWLIISLL